MAHTVPGLLRKAPFTKEGCGPQGDKKMYSVELTEVVKDYKTGEKTYSNYKAMFFAGTANAIAFYDKAFAEGSFVVIDCEKLKVETRDHNGTTYVTLQMENARLSGANYPENSAPQQGYEPAQQPPAQQAAPQMAPAYQPQQAPAPQHAPQTQPASQPTPAPAHNEPSMDFKDDIPF